MDRDLETVYDEQIAPLMTRIIEICRENKMPVLASFQFAPDSFCTTAMLFDGDKRLAMATQMIQEGFVAFAVAPSLSAAEEMPVEDKAEVSLDVVLYTDGACQGNPGPGGWAVILRRGEHEQELSGGEPHTTNNRMELMAVIEGLSALDRPANVTVFTDSQYVANAFNQGWLNTWQRNGWRTSTKKPVANQDLWEQLLDLTRIHHVAWNWVKGHANDSMNLRVDRLAVAAARKQ